jgi:hypothetical protein
MAVLPIKPAPFFANKNRAFWNLQFAGWGGAMLLRVMSAIANAQPLDFYIKILIAGITGFSISLILAVIYRQLINRKPLITWAVTSLCLAVAVVLYAFIDAWILELGTTHDSSFATLMLGVFYLDLTLLGAWSALYYAINYFLQVEAQTDQLAQLELQATTAQLEMLRYQLNPHFLFNTLNSISTLVLLKQTEPANAMLTRLSAFLRHTLVNEPGGKVTVHEEVETLKLYLDIELMRFEQRLRTEFKVDPAAANALLPSLLLQPLVENAIKYAVSPQEEGAKISVSARLVGRRLRITVSDTGPGLQSAQGSASLAGLIAGSGGAASSTGVGLANIRDRLAQAYGDDHVFEIRTPAQGGFTVVIEIPYEAAAQETKPAPAVPPVSAQPATAPMQRKLGFNA